VIFSIESVVFLEVDVWFDFLVLIGLVDIWRFDC
jgi:hypothetical protein